MQVGVPYTFKVRVETLPGTGHLYQFKAWESALTEPGPWKLEALVPPNGLASGSILLIGHRLDISFGDVSITPLGP